MRVLVCGGRDYNDVDAVKANLNSLNKKHGPFSVLIEGGARGADHHARNWAIVNSIPVEEYEADWDTLGAAAGPIRNREMLESGKPDLVVAFPGGKGTANMVKQAKEVGVKVVKVA